MYCSQMHSYMTSSEAALYLRIKERTLYDLVASASISPCTGDPTSPIPSKKLMAFTRSRESATTLRRSAPTTSPAPVLSHIIHERCQIAMTPRHHTSSYPFEKMAPKGQWIYHGW